MTRTASGVLTIEDTRPVAVAPRFSFDGVEAAAYAAADQGDTAEEIARALKASPRHVEDILQGFVASRLMVNLGGIYLALAAPFRDYIPRERVPGGYLRTKRRADTVDPGSLTLEQMFGLR